MTGARFVPGHDSQLHGWMLRVERGVIALKDIPHDGIRKAVAAAMAAAGTKAGTVTKTPKPATAPRLNTRNRAAAAPATDGGDNQPGA